MPEAKARTTMLGVAPTKQDWELHRAKIEQLYLKEQRTLRQVMEMMRELHDFRATEKMYKSRFTAWGTDRKNKRPSTRKQRKLPNTRKMSRAGTIHSTIEGPDRQSGCSSKSTEGQAMKECMPDNLQSVEIERSRPRPTSRGPDRALSTELDSLEIAFRTVSSYVVGSCGVGSRLRTLSCDDGSALTFKGNPRGDLMQLYYEARHWANSGQLPKAVERIASSKNIVASILAVQCPTTLHYIFNLSQYLIKSNRCDLSTTLFRSIYDIGAALLPRNHPILQVCFHLSAAGPGRFIDYGTVIALDVMRDAVANALGPSHRLAMVVRLDYILRIDFYRSPDHGESALMELLEADEFGTEILDDPSLGIRRALVQTHIANRKYLEGLAMAEDLIRRAQSCERKIMVDHYCSEGYFALGQLYSLVGERDQALSALAQGEEVLYQAATLRRFRVFYLLNRINVVRAAQGSTVIAKENTIQRMVNTHTLIPASSAAESCPVIDLFASKQDLNFNEPTPKIEELHPESDDSPTLSLIPLRTL